MVREAPYATTNVAFGLGLTVETFQDLLLTTPLVTCLLGALDRRHPESLSTGWSMTYLDTQVRQ